MLNRRQFVSTSAAALLAGMPSAFAATYDLVIKGGRVIDPSMGLDATRDIAISGGRIAAIEASIAAGCRRDPRWGSMRRVTLQFLAAGSQRSKPALRRMPPRPSMRAAGSSLRV